MTAPALNGAHHIWLIDEADFQTPQQLDQFQRWMNAEEQARWQRYRFDKDKHQFLISRAMVRMILSAYAPQIAPSDWQFDKNQYGKPQISAKLQAQLPQPIYFNLSHCTGCIALLVSHSAHSGIDVERSEKQSRNLDELAQYCFHEQEISQYQALEQHQKAQRFYQIWTLKEAYIKALGTGLATEPNSFAFEMQANQVTEFRQTANDHFNHWQFEQRSLTAHIELAIAIAEQPQNLPFCWLTTDLS